MREQHKEFQKITNEMFDLYVKKNNDYSSTNNDNIGSLGAKGIFVRMWDKISRLRSLVWEEREAQVKDETVVDTIMDLGIYCIIFLIWMRGKWGK